MVSGRKKCIYVATHSWDAPVKVGSHHIASYLAQHFDLLYVSHPVSLSSFVNFRYNYFGSRLCQAFSKPKQLENGITEIVPISLLAASPRSILNSSVVVQHAWRTAIPSLNRQIKQLDFDQPALCVLDTPYQGHYIDIVKPKSVWVRLADDPFGLGSFSAPMQSSLRCTLDRAHLVVAPSALIISRIKDQIAQIEEGKMQVVENGIDLSHLSKAVERPIEMRTDKPMAIFVGSLGHWVDFKLISATAKMTPGYEFLIIGSAEQLLSAQSSRLPDNLRVLGPKAYEQLPGYFQYATVGLLPFDVKGYPDLVNGANTIKMYEYLAAGLQVVSTQIRQAQSLNVHVHVVDQSPVAFSEAIIAADQRALPKVPDTVIKSWDWRERLAVLQPVIEDVVGA